MQISIALVAVFLISSVSSERIGPIHKWLRNSVPQPQGRNKGVSSESEPFNINWWNMADKELTEKKKRGEIPDNTVLSPGPSQFQGAPSIFLLIGPVSGNKVKEANEQQKRVKPPHKNVLAPRSFQEIPEDDGFSFPWWNQAINDLNDKKNRGELPSHTLLSPGRRDFPGESNSFEDDNQDDEISGEIDEADIDDIWEIYRERASNRGPPLAPNPHASRSGAGFKSRREDSDDYPDTPEWSNEEERDQYENNWNDFSGEDEDQDEYRPYQNNLKRGRAENKRTGGIAVRIMIPPGKRDEEESDDIEDDFPNKSNFIESLERYFGKLFYQ